MECHKIERYENGRPVYRLKKKFNTLDEAIAQAKYVNSGEFVIHKVVAYKCKVCLKYHLGRNGKLLTDKQRLKYKLEHC